MALSLYEIKKILNPKKEVTVSDDFRVIDSWAEYDERAKDVNERPLEYLCYELESMNPDTGEKTHYYKAIKFARVIRLPKSAKQSLSFMEMHSQVLSGVYEEGYNLITIIANIIEPVALGLLFMYGLQGTGKSIEEAKETAKYAYIGFTSMMQGTYRVLEMRCANAQETEWLREKMYSMDYLSVLRGIPKAAQGGEDAGNKGIGGRNLNPDSQGTLEEMISGMADYEYVIQVLSTPVYMSTLKDWALRTKRDMTTWNSQLQGTKAFSLSLSLPMMFAANQSASQGWSKGYTDANSVSFSQGESFNQGYGENVGQALSNSYGQAFGESNGISESESVSQSHSISNTQSYSENIGISSGYGQNTSNGFNTGQSQNQSIGSGTNEGLNQGMSVNHSTGTNVGSSFGESMGESLNSGHSINATSGHSLGKSEGVSVGTSETVGATTGTTMGATNGITNGQNVGTNYSVSNSHSENSGWSFGTNVGASESHGGSASLNRTSGATVTQGDGGNNGISALAASTGTNYSNSLALNNATSMGNSKNFNLGSSWGESNGISGGSSDGISVSGGQSAGISQSISQSSSLSQSASNSHSIGSSIGKNIGASESFSTSTGESISQSFGSNHGISTSQSIAQNTSDSWGDSLGVSKGVSQSMSAGIGTSTGNSFSNGTSYSISNTKSQGMSYGMSESFGVTNGFSRGRTYSQSVTDSYSQGQTDSYGQSKSVSMGNSVSNGTGKSQSETLGASGAYMQGSSSSMGLGPSIGYNKSYQWKDQQVEDILKLLTFQNDRLELALRGCGAFYTYVYIACPDQDALSAAKALAKSTWQNDGALMNPVQVLDLHEEEQKHLLYHFTAFSSDMARMYYNGAYEYKYATVLLPNEFAAYTHLPRISEGGVFSDVNDVPKFSVPSMLKGEIYMGTVLSAERYTMKNGYRTPYDYRIDEAELMHGFFTGASRSGKTVAAMRFVAELSHVRRKDTGKRLRIICMDPKQDWRTLARFVEPERFRFHSLGNMNFRPIKINPFKIPKGVQPQYWVDGIIDIYCRAYGLLERGKQMMAETIYSLYEEAGVFKACQEDNWKETVPILSQEVNFKSVYERMEKLKKAKEDEGRVGNETKDAYARLLDRLQAFSKDRYFSIEQQLFGTSEGIAIDELIGDDDITVLESKGLESTFRNFIFGVITSGFYKYALAHEGGYKSESQYETVLIIEEANEVLTGNDCAGTGGGASFGMSGQSEFEQILDQAAGYGLYIMAITQKIADMPKSIIANSGLIFAGRLKTPDDITVVVRAIGREERMDDRDVAKWFPRSPTGWFICQSSRTFDFKEAEPIMVQIARLNIAPPSNSEIDEMMTHKEALKQAKLLEERRERRRQKNRNIA